MPHSCKHELLSRMKACNCCWLRYWYPRRCQAFQKQIQLRPSDSIHLKCHWTGINNRFYQQEIPIVIYLTNYNFDVECYVSYFFVLKVLAYCIFFIGALLVISLKWVHLVLCTEKSFLSSFYIQYNSNKCIAIYTYFQFLLCVLAKGTVSRQYASLNELMF